MAIERRRFPGPAVVALAAIMLILGACARVDHRPEVIQGTPQSPPARPSVETGAAEDPGPGRVRVRQGDSLFLIARRNGVPLRGLIEANGLKAPYVIYPNQIIKLPGKAFHIVQENDSIYSISQRFNVDMAELVRVNRIPPPYRIEKGQRLQLPGAGRQGEARNAAVGRQHSAARPDPRPASGPAALPKPDRQEAVRPPSPPPRASDPKPVGEPPKRSSGKFLWPVRGRILVGFGPRKGGFHNDGINIAASKGTPVLAAENGVVVYTGNQLRGFGNMVLLRHSEGWMSAYAHNDRVLVSRGQTIRRGQIIARVGSSGNVGSPQLHFELRRGDQAVDPRRYLVRFAESTPSGIFAAVFR